MRCGGRPVAADRWRPHCSLNIRGGGAGAFILKGGSNDIGTLSGQQQFRGAHECATYTHGGCTYHVKEVFSAGNRCGSVAAQSALGARSYTVPTPGIKRMLYRLNNRSVTEFLRGSSEIHIVNLIHMISQAFNEVEHGLFRL